MNDISPATIKIHILYLVSRAPGVSYQMLMDKCLESLYMDFFSFSQAYTELISGNLMDKTIVDTGTDEVVGNNETITITRGGLAILEAALPSIKPQINDYLKRAAAELSEKVRQLNAVKAIVSDGNVAILTDNSGESGISDEIRISITCKDKAAAEALCRGWRAGGSKAAGEIFSMIMNNGDKTND